MNLSICEFLQMSHITLSIPLQFSHDNEVSEFFSTQTLSKGRVFLEKDTSTVLGFLQNNIGT